VHDRTVKDVDAVIKSGAEKSTSREPTVPRTNRLVGSYLALLLFMFIYCARPEDWIPGLSHVPLAKVAVLLALLSLLFSLKYVRLRLPREIIYVVLMVGQLLLASALSPVWRGGAFQKTLDFAKVLIVIVLMAVATNTLRRLWLLIVTQTASVVSIAAVTLWKGHLVLGRLDGMLGGNYSDPNDLALAFVISFPMCLALLLLTRSWLLKATWMSALVVLTYAIFLTGSRGGFLSFLVTGAVCLWAFAIRGRRPYLLALAVLSAVIGGSSSGGILIGRLRGTFDVKQNMAAANESAQARQQLFWRSVEVTKEHPLFGVGPGNFEQISGSWHVAHNSYTQISSEGGIPALILYLLVLWGGFKYVRQTRRFVHKQKGTNLFANGLQASLVGYVAGSCFLSVSYAFFPYFLVAYTTVLFSITSTSADQSITRRPKLRRKQQIPYKTV
jgi:putative inorganic carbon (hco3(-)) transporter